MVSASMDSLAPGKPPGFSSHVRPLPQWFRLKTGTKIRPVAGLFWGIVLADLRKRRSFLVSDSWAHQYPLVNVYITMERSTIFHG